MPTYIVFKQYGLIRIKVADFCKRWKCSLITNSEYNILIILLPSDFQQTHRTLPRHVYLSGGTYFFSKFCPRDGSGWIEFEFAIEIGISTYILFLEVPFNTCSKQVTETIIHDNLPIFVYCTYIGFHLEMIRDLGETFLLSYASWMDTWLMMLCKKGEATCIENWNFNNTILSL